MAMNNLSEALLRQQFLQHFPAAHPEAIEILKAPGRVNLIGEHTDYNNGFVLPIAINYYTYIIFSPRDDRELHIVASNFNNELIVIDGDQPMRKASAAHWSNYIRGVIAEMLRNGYKNPGGQLMLAGNIPIGAGLSSSASLEIATIRALTKLSKEKMDPTSAALIGQAAENNFVGCNTGIMDQLIIARAEPSSALLIDCEDLSTRPVAIPEYWQLLIVHSGVKRGLVDSEYNTRRQQCENAAAHLGKSSLRQLRLDDLLAAEAELDPLIFRRARHVLTENARTLAAADALVAGDMASLALLMAESHASMRDDFNITTPAIDTLVQILTSAGDGEAGARMTGGGFGGCVVAIAPATVIPRLIIAVEQNYQSQTGYAPILIPARAVAGAFAEQ